LEAKNECPGVPRSGDARANRGELSRAALLLSQALLIIVLVLELVLDLKADKVIISPTRTTLSLLQVSEKFKSSGVFSPRKRTSKVKILFRRNEKKITTKGRIAAVPFCNS
jgi:hypothetical protein